ncbi:hypothetical protein LEMLEM_LOCUS26271 [Lemmus lemmus]
MCHLHRSLHWGALLSAVPYAGNSQEGHLGTPQCVGLVHGHLHRASPWLERTCAQ